MLLNLKHLILTTIVILSFSLPNQAQDKKLIDQIAATVGDKKILQSDIENQRLQIQAQSYKAPTKCEILNDLVAQKMLLIQAQKDSITVSDNQVEAELEQRLRYFIRQIGSEEELENYYNKSIQEIRQDFRSSLREQILTQQMQNQLINDVEVTPVEVEKYYKNLPEDSIPTINEKVKINQIVKYPGENEESETKARERLLDLRKRILDGQRFSTLARLYSDDPGTASKGGELGYRTEEELDPAFADAAFGLKKEEISGIVESAYGFHLIQLIDRDDDEVNVRHILITPDVSYEQKQAVRNKLDSISTEIKAGNISFEEAARKFSDDDKYRMNGGLMVNPQTSSNTFELDQLPSADYEAIEDLEKGDISEPYEAQDENGKSVFKIVRIKDKIEKHKANLKEDYSEIKQMALERKQQKYINKWLKKKKKDTYIKIDESFQDCDLKLSF
ncbi:MAG: peptidylprolyl isomerase [Bacteroidales bacterium]